MTKHCFLVEERISDKESWKKVGIVDLDDIELALKVLERDKLIFNKNEKKAVTRLPFFACFGHGNASCFLEVFEIPVYSRS